MSLIIITIQDVETPDGRIAQVSMLAEPDAHTVVDLETPAQQLAVVAIAAINDHLEKNESKIVTPGSKLIMPS